MMTRRPALAGARPSGGLLPWVALAAAILVSGSGLAQQTPVSQPVMMADFNGDGIPDALVMSTTTPTATIAFGSVPYGTFSSGAVAVTFPANCASFYTGTAGSSELLAGDFNGDGLADLLFTCRTGTGNSPYVTGVMLGLGDGTFGTPVILPVGFSTGAVLGDFNRDGKLDVAAIGFPLEGSGGYGIFLFSGNGDGTFGAPVFSSFGTSSTFSPNNVIDSAALADVNGDGFPDLVMESIFSLSDPTGAPRTLSVFGNNQDGTFGLAQQSARVPNTTAVLGTYPDSNAYTVLVGNVFGSGKADFLIPDVGTTPGVFVVKNMSTATTFSLAAAVKTPYAGLIDAKVGTLTGSGFTDLAVANGTTIAVLANDGSGNFQANYGTLTLAAATSSVINPFAVADINGDGYADIVTARQGTTLQVSVNLVNGTASATSQPFSPGSLGTVPVTARWGGNLLFNGVTANGTQTVVGVPTMTALTSSKNPSNVGDAVTFTAVVAPLMVGSGTPSGTVFFTDGTAMLGSGTLDGSGRVSVTSSALTAATHVIEASYTGDAQFAPSLAPVVSQVVNRIVQVAPVLTWATPAPITYGTALTGAQLNAVATNALGAPVDGAFVYAPGAGTVLNAGTQTLSVTFTPSDLTTYSIATQTVPLTVLQVTSVSTTLTVTASGGTVTQVAAGTVVTLTAAVAAGTVPVTAGQVKFCDAAAAYCTDIHLLGTAQLTSAGTATVRFVPAIGNHVYKSIFAGTGNNAGSTTAVGTLLVTGMYSTTTTIAQSGSAGNYTLTGTVAGLGGGAAGPSGAVSFVDQTNGNAVLGTGVLGSGSSTLSFTNVASPSTGSTPIGVKTADLNGDGKADLIVNNSAGGDLTILLGNGDGTFQAAPSPRTGGYPSSVALGDFNRDGKLDLAVTSYYDSIVTVLLGNGDGTFTAAPASPATGTDARSVVTDDFNGDGILDLAVSRDNSVTILLGNGDGSFTAGASVPAGSGPNYSIATSDFNGDGKPDLVVTNQAAGTVSVLLGRGDGTFTLASSPAAGTYPSSVTVADLNGDGKVDLAVVNVSSQLVVLLGNGDGTFTAAASPTVGSSPQGVSAGDFNGDGKVDLAVANQQGSTVTVLLGKGDGTFAAPLTVAAGNGSNNSAIADFDGDGIADLATSNVLGNSVSVLLARTVQTVVATATGVSPAGAGTHSVVASYPGDASFAGSASSATSLTGFTVTPVVTWTPAVSSIVFGTPLGPQQLNAVATGVGGAPVAGTFAYTPAAGTVLGAGTRMLGVVFTPSDPLYVAVAANATITVTQAVPVVSWAAPTAIAYGTPLSGTQLNASVAGVGGTALAGTLTYSPAAGVVLAPGTQMLTLSFVPTDALDYTTATGRVNLVVTGPTLNAITPAAVPLGSGSITLTLTGSGFVTNSVVLVNGVQVATTYVSNAMLTAVVPAANFTSTGTLPVKVSDPSIGALSAALTLTVIPANPAVTLSGPTVTAPGSQPAVSLALTNPYPLDLTAVFSLGFASAGTPAVDDPAIQFAAGGRTLRIVVPANSTVVPPIQLQAGTDAGTITIPLLLTAGGVNVTPTGLAPVVIVVPGTVPNISTTTITRNAGTLSVAIHGFSNTREVTQATFHFVAAPGATISTPDITAPVGTAFAGWFGSTASPAFGSTFTYTQVFNVSDDANNIGSVQVTLTNGIGTSALQAAQ